LAQTIKCEEGKVKDSLHRCLRALADYSGSTCDAGAQRHNAWNGVPRGGRPEDLRFPVRDELPGRRGGGAAEGGVAGRKQAHEARFLFERSAGTPDSSGREAVLVDWHGRPACRTVAHQWKRRVISGEWAGLRAARVSGACNCALEGLGPGWTGSTSRVGLAVCTLPAQENLTCWLGPWGFAASMEPIIWADRLPLRLVFPGF